MSILIVYRPKRRGKAKAGAFSVSKSFLFAEAWEKGRMGFLFRAANMGFTLFTIVKKFTFKMLWIGSCLGFMFIMPCLFEIAQEQEAVLEKI